ncbi:type II 3-dehydroquinate dehydratase [Pseudorhodoplanes sp.]|uniref:type II 3-dehydroquinate dehydratase n=1 Tax=Pseudorhodoplanes sp. TaxID=1934341 RepID=UPI002C2ED20C|nr:type II 3-dehydroquinate dehydratase [Pseudorhodoplanes sp.]HWV55480.1 type II 3-dehydroquinate dehydratase [Pseudorhodoplanes sp.]
MLRIKIINGPNLNLLGVREPHIYGTTTLAEIQRSCENTARELKARLTFLQSNHEGQIVDWIQAARDDADAVILNPAGYSFYSVAIFDALKAFEGPIVELHLSNIHARDELHRHSIMSRAATAVICGLGPAGYLIAMQAAAQLVEKKAKAGATHAA